MPNDPDFLAKLHHYKTARLRDTSPYYSTTNDGFVRVLCAHSSAPGLLDIEHPKLGRLTLHFDHLQDFCL